MIVILLALVHKLQISYEYTLLSLILDEFFKGTIDLAAMCGNASQLRMKQK